MKYSITLLLLALAFGACAVMTRDDPANIYIYTVGACLAFVLWMYVAYRAHKAGDDAGEPIIDDGDEPAEGEVV